MLGGPRTVWVPRSILKNIIMRRAFSRTTEVDTVAQKCSLIKGLMSHLVHISSISPLAIPVESKERSSRDGQKSSMKRYWLTCHVPDRYPLGSLIKVYMAWNWHFQPTIMPHEEHRTELILPYTSAHSWPIQPVLSFAIFTPQSSWKTHCFPALHPT